MEVTSLGQNEYRVLLTNLEELALETLQMDRGEESPAETLKSCLEMEL